MAQDPTFRHQLGCRINSMIQDDACGEIIAFVRRDSKLVHEVIDPYDIHADQIQQYEMVLFDGGNTAGDSWKHVFFPQCLQHYFVNENPAEPLSQ